MKVRVTFRPRRRDAQVVNLSAKATVGDLLAAVGESRDHTLVIRGATPITEAEPLRDGDDVTLLSAFSGG